MLVLTTCLTRLDIQENKLLLTFASNQHLVKEMCLTSSSICFHTLLRHVKIGSDSLFGPGYLYQSTLAECLSRIQSASAQPLSISASDLSFEANLVISTVMLLERWLLGRE